MVLQFVGRPSPHHEIDRVPQPPRQVVGSGRQLRRQVSRHGGILATRGDRAEDARIEPPALAHHVDAPDREGRQADEEQRHLRILDPVAGQVADHERVGHDAGVDQREEGEGESAAPEQG